MPDWLAVILLGIIEGITEFLPISSTAHLLIVGRWIAPQSDLFTIVIQSGAVLAVIPVFADRCRSLALNLADPETRLYAAKLLFAFVLTGVGGVLLEESGYTLLDETVAPVAWALIVGGVLFVSVETWHRPVRATDTVSWSVAAVVGLGQLVAAIFPGASRSGTTILLALLLGLRRPAAIEFSFLVGIPTMLAAGGLKIFKALGSDSNPAEGNPENWAWVGLGTLVSALVSFLAVKWLLRYVQTHTFVLFGWYRIALGGLLLLLGAAQK